MTTQVNTDRGLKSLQVERQLGRLDFAHLIVLHSCRWAGCQAVCLPLFWHPPRRHWGHLPHLLECGSIVKLPLRAYGCLNHCSPAFPPDYSISQSYCWLKIRWRIHAVEAYLNRAHTLRSIGFHHEFPRCTWGMTQLMWEFVPLPFTLSCHINTR